MNAIGDFFHVHARRSTVGREVRGGLTTFLTMAYILAVNPSILERAGMPVAAVATSTAVAAGVCCILMGVWANFPMALASGMGLNAMVAIQLTAATGSWQVAMGLVVLNGVVILLLVLAGLREAVMRAIPRELRAAIGAGIGLFIAFIGLQNGGFVVGHPATFVTAGKLSEPTTLIAAGGVVLTALLMIRKVTGAIVIGIAACTAAALFVGVTTWSGAFATPDFSVMFQADVLGAAKWAFVPLLLTVLMVDFFDTLGTATAVAEQGGMADAKGNVPGIRRVLVVDSVAAGVGGALGASSTTSYIESAAGVAEGARTGLHTVVVGVLFLAAAFCTPLATMVPKCATAPALILVGFLMMSQVAEIDFGKYASAIPAFLTVLGIPLTFSIAHGIGLGFCSYVLLHVLTGQFGKVHPLMYLVAAAFGTFFALGA